MRSQTSPGKTANSGRRRKASCSVLGVLIFAASISALVVFSGCGDQSGATAGGHGDGADLFPKLPHVRGHIDVVEANPDNLRHFRVLRITDDDGNQWEFQSEDWVGVSVGHLKDHQIHGTPVSVWYEKRSDGSLLARFVGD